MATTTCQHGHVTIGDEYEPAEGCIPCATSEHDRVVAAVAALYNDSTLRVHVTSPMSAPAMGRVIGVGEFVLIAVPWGTTSPAVIGDMSRELMQCRVTPRHGG